MKILSLELLYLTPHSLNLLSNFKKAIRLLDAVEELAKALNVSADYLTDAELDYGGEECLYQVWLESDDRFKLYITASSKRMAFLIYGIL